MRPFEFYGHKDGRAVTISEPVLPIRDRRPILNMF